MSRLPFVSTLVVTHNPVGGKKGTFFKAEIYKHRLERHRQWCHGPIPSRQTELLSPGRRGRGRGPLIPTGPDIPKPPNPQAESLQATNPPSYPKPEVLSNSGWGT